MSRRKSSVSCELVKRGRRTYGGVYTLASGERIYLAYRRQGDIYRSKEKTISDAVRAGVAHWGLDVDHLIMAKTRGIRFVGVLDRATGDVFVTYTAFFFDRENTKTIDQTLHGGSVQRYLPLSYFRRSYGKVKI